MKIKRLEILGFKSFPDKTVVEFQQGGITAVVGPNGCGKSNIVDAMRWVMGEMSAKHLRGKSMEDVIFAGSQARPATGMAEVTMILSNDDGRAPAAYASYSEIAVTRRLFRSGESEYELNKTPCRLKDIYDLFLGSGVGTKAYSIIEQGKIGQIISAKPEDRRMVIEEAAGISKFKSRKEAALRKMEATQGNLLRLADIIAELKRQINSLDRQARKAERYREIEGELKGLELHLSSLDYLKHSTELKDLEGGLQALEEKSTSLSAQVSQDENQIETDRLTLLDQERELSTLQELLYEKNNAVQLHQTAIDYKTREIETLARQNETSSGEIEVAKTRLAELSGQVESSNQNQLQVDLAVATAQENFKQLETQLQDRVHQEKDLLLKIDQLSQSTLSAMQEISSLGSKREGLSRRKLDLAGRIGKDRAEIEELQRQINSQQSKKNQLQGQLGEVKQLKLDLTQQLESIVATIATQKTELQEAEGELDQIKETLSLKNSRLTSLEELEKNFEGYKEGVRNVMLKRSQIDPDSRIFGTVADIVETDPHYELAVGAALGEKLQYVVVKSQEVGVDALQYLKTESSGRLSCIPVELREEQGQASEHPHVSEGLIGPLKEFVRIKNDYHRIGDYLFNGVYLVENLNRALQIWNGNGHRKTLVTLDGEVVDPSGIVSGGSKESGAQSLLEKKREIKDLKGELEILNARQNEQNLRVAKYRSRITSLEESLEILKRDSHSEELKIVHQEQDLNHLASELKRLNDRHGLLSREITEAAEEETQTQAEIERLGGLLSEFENKKHQSQLELDQSKESLAKLRLGLEVLRQQHMEQRSNLTLAQEKKVNFERELQRAIQEKNEQQRRLEEKHSAITNANQQMTALKQQIEESRIQISEMILVIKEKENAGAALKQSIGELKENIQNQEIRLRQNRQQLEEARQELNRRLVNLGDGRTKIQVLRQQILERYHVDLTEIAAQYAEQVLDVETAVPRVAELREKLDKIGAVNLGAIEEYEELKTRFEFLSKQHQDLEESLNALNRALQKINRTTKKRFEETFHKVNELFQEVFPKLFKGGKAELLLTQPENILESGVEIVAQPPGKKLQSVSLLSGGEKALTAVSLVFAIFIIKPSPFCLLDEVDAPLDDANIDRFNDMVRSLMDRSQFILITHNKRTMEMADTLYGITMEQPGVSKLVSVQLQ